MEWMLPVLSMEMGEQMHDATFNMELWIAWHPIKFLPGHHRIWKSAFIQLDWIGLDWNDISVFSIFDDICFELDQNIQPFSSYRTDKLRSLKTKATTSSGLWFTSISKPFCQPIKANRFPKRKRNVKLIRTKAQRTIKHQLQNVLWVYHEQFSKNFIKWSWISAARIRTKSMTSWKEGPQDFVLHCEECLLHQSLNQKRLSFQLNTFQKRSNPLIFSQSLECFK